ncbi:hypothetical protein E2C01_072537 [Portunus trituberculatus]|uniref:Uncharacterized protein n=1 Tax=Portunus trituberculatus TaxID=210409 RepID=A0A5B7I6Z3_PORTR|nr:hypothetical protein [Portunus trituberculatus]
MIQWTSEPALVAMAQAKKTVNLRFASKSKGEEGGAATRARVERDLRHDERRSKREEQERAK